jgi:hypothetical protein
LILEPVLKGFYDLRLCRHRRRDGFSRLPVTPVHMHRFLEARVDLAIQWLEEHTSDFPSGQRIPLYEQQIAADGSGFTSPAMLRDLFGLHQCT